MPRTKQPAKAGGRKTTFKEEYIPQAYEATRWGMDIPGLARLFGVVPTTIHKWRRGDEEFDSAIKRGRHEHDSKGVVNALLQRATGFEYDEIHEEFIEIDGKMFTERSRQVENDGKTFTVKEMVEGRKMKIVHKTVVPDVMAMMYWLQNRQPDEWKNVQSQKIETTAKVDHTHRLEVDLSKLDRSKLEQLRNIVGEARSRALSDGTGNRERPGARIPVPFRPTVMANG